MKHAHPLSRISAAALALLLTLTGCGPKNRVETFSGRTQPEVSLTFFGNKYEPGNVTVIEEILTSFMLQDPNVSISYESLKGSAYYEALRKRMETGHGDDIFIVDHDTALALSQEGLLQDLSGLDTISDLSAPMLDQMEAGGQILWVPTTVSAFGLYCNLDLLKAHGQAVPENLPEWERVCGYFVEQGIVPIVANNDISLKTLAIARGFYPLYQSGTQREVFRQLSRGEAALSSYLTDGFSLVQRFIDRGYVDAEKALVTKKTSDDLAEFARGESPFLLTGGWAANRVKEMEPGFAFTVVAYPVLDDGAVLVINPDTRMAVNAGSGHVEEAMAFVTHFTQRENIQKFADDQCSFSPLTGGAPSSAVEIQPLVDTYQAGRTVIGSDAYLQIPIWDLTADCAQKLLAGEELEAVMIWLDSQLPAGGAAHEN